MLKRGLSNGKKYGENVQLKNISHMKSNVNPEIIILRVNINRETRFMVQY
ncbi:MAG: hypothetical protein ACTSU4_07900 [Promethearchaeota archaeon]